jgi:hypothetical protein
MFLRRIEVREKLTDDGKFIGFEVVRLKGDPTFWQGVDLRPNDLILRVNGQPIGHYSQAFKLWQSMATAPMLVVTFERAGQPHEYRLQIHDDSPDGGAPPAPPVSGWPKPASAPPDAGASG